MRTVALLLLIAGSLGCDSATSADAGPADAGAVDASAPDAGPPALDPATFDCRASAPPDRASTRPLNCAVDAACTARLVSAHRGAGVPGVLAPEDTLSAIRAAIALGADLTEVDAQPTSDDVLVLIHDETVQRTTEGRGRVSELTLAEIQAFPMRADAYSGDFSCDRVPTLVDALELARGRITVIVDAKTDRIDLLVEAIVEADALDSVIVDLEPDEVDAALALEPGLNFFVRAETVAELSPLLTRFTSPAPRYVNVGASTQEALLSAARDGGQRVFALAFGADVAAEVRGTTMGYESLWDDGVQILQCNRPDLAAPALSD